jgi:penicillin-binding protein 1A
MARVLGWLGALVALAAVLAVIAGGGVLYVFYRYGGDLPDYQQLGDYEPPTVTRVHAGDGRLLAEYAVQKRVFVPVEAMPKRVVDAFLAAEDQHFYSHFGIDLRGVVRAAISNAANLWRGNRRPVGASTITQQVAKNFLLSNELSIERKIREAILAVRIERALSKHRILELYLNEIYLGYGSYGVAAAALNYFDRSLDELTLEEAAYLAALPKAPSNYHPIYRHGAAVGRRDWVIGRMVDERFITPEAGAAARLRPLLVRRRGGYDAAAADYFAEDVRRELVKRFGERGLYEGGLSVRTTLDSRLQDIARRALRQGLIAYDRRHGWRGPLARFVDMADWRQRLAAYQPPLAMGEWLPALVLSLSQQSAEIGFADGRGGLIPLAELKWARAWRAGQRLGPEIRHPSDVLAIGDLVAVTAVDPVRPIHALHQIPEVDGGIIAMDPHTGRVLAMVGGYQFADSQYNRATQALRQPGSAFKPIVYAAALENGFTPSSLILDAPFVIDQGPGLGKWKPANYTRKFYGPSTLRLGIEKSRNLMTVRLAQFIGMDSVVDMARRFGVVNRMPARLSMALGAGESTLMRMVAAYAMLVNGGKRIVPSLIDRVQDRRGRTIFRHDDRPCDGCVATAWRGQSAPLIADGRATIVDSSIAYQLVSILQGVVERGTGRRVSAVGKPLGGKTGTTNDSKDTWFIGFSPDLAAGVFVGFDRPRSLGRSETGSSVAAPIFRDFMAAALADQPAIPFRIPSGVRLVRVNATTGLLARAGDSNVILEAFRPGTEPTSSGLVLDGSGAALTIGEAPLEGTDGLY